MFWILRRTGAATFFNSINNNYSSSKSNVNNNNASDKNNQRPQRKEYGRLSIEDDSNMDMLTRNDSLDNFDDFNKNSSKNSTIDKYSNENVSNADSEYQLDRNSGNKLNPLSESNCNRLAMAISDDDEYDESLTCNLQRL
ncbi:hypothetical protein Bhyg_12792 [Pseudolycoriella hygida]|uniref:Uncharacterized protein n=1 Tax=Pseudolycoriella hygida TaxID=35572 RepID=A0A9Q0MY68_9DIPT|nr:hypothetical protein Bhyg_12792 [Pseudolycoriella hygida]